MREYLSVLFAALITLLLFACAPPGGDRGNDVKINLTTGPGTAGDGSGNTSTGGNCNVNEDCQSLKCSSEGVCLP